VLIRLKIDRMEPLADGKEFGTVGGYLRITGTAYGELDPYHPLNSVIVNLDKAPRNVRGLVEYEADFDIMRPADVGRGNRKILYEVVNRGRKNLLPVLHEASESSPGAFNDPTTASDAGTGFTFRAGYTLVWSGWDPDAPRANRGLSMRAPVATDAGAPIVKTIRDEFVFGTRVPTTRLTAPLSYAAATLDQSQACLTVRAKEGDPRTTIPPSQWTYADARSIKLLPEGTPFQPGLIYDFWYPAKDPKVLGIGFAATRDLVSFLRYEARDRAGNANPVALNGGDPGIRAVLAFGVSQSGRYLRDHVALGFNQDETGRKVIDGILSHVAGVGKVFANYEFGQPYRTRTQHEDHWFPENHFPFAHATLADPVTGQTGGLWRGDGFDPFVMEVNTSTEYWQKGASLLHTDPLGQQDIAIPPSVRHYLVAGTQHGGRSGMRAARGSGVHPRNPHDPTPMLRALLVALDQWVTEGVEPPDSRVPTLAAGTLVAPKDLQFPAIPEVQAPGFANGVDVLTDWVRPESTPARAYTPLVPQVDGDGNEIAGIRLPAIAVPLATHTGWNLYKTPYPEGELCDREGSYLPFARTKSERLASGDPRPSLEERYGNHEAYIQRVKDDVRDLLEARLLLVDDAVRFVDDAVAGNLFKP
jgi:Alpha/beta hydrolase domain